MNGFFRNFRIFAVIFLVQTLAHADWDAEAGFAARSLPFGAGAYGDIGYGSLIWGEEGKNPLAYGYWRPAVEISSSYFVNRGSAVIHFFPIGVFGLSAGQIWSTRSRDLPNLDCGAVRCDGAWSGPFAKAQLALGYQKFFALYVRSLTFIQSADSSRPIAEEYSVLVGKADRDRLCNSDLITGYQLSEQWSTGVQYKVQRMLDSDNSNETLTAYGRWENGEYAITGSVGQYASPTEPRGFMAQALFEWHFKKRMGLF